MSNDMKWPIMGSSPINSCSFGAISSRVGALATSSFVIFVM